MVADRGAGASPRYRYGSGCAVAGRVVLTAAHTVVGAVTVLVRDVDKVGYPAVVVVAEAGEQRPDLALLEVGGGWAGVPPIGLAAVDRDSTTGAPVERCSAVGYPLFMERPAPGNHVVRDTAAAYGHVPVLSGLASGLLSVQVSSAPRDLPDGSLDGSPWAGMSGAPVFADGLLLGVVTEHAPRAGPSTITVTPLTAIEADPRRAGWGAGVAEPAAWWRRLGVSGPGDLTILPAVPRVEVPRYLATVREIRARTPLLVGREEKLEQLRSFATGDAAYRWLVAGPFAGKTALLAELVVSAMPPETDVISYFLSRREANASARLFLTEVVPQLAYLLGEPSPTPDPVAFRHLWQKAARRAEHLGRHLLLVVDGLDEEVPESGVAELLPTVDQRNVHVLVSSRPDLGPPAGHPLQGEREDLVAYDDADKIAAAALREIDQLARDDDVGVAVLGLLTAAAAGLSEQDLAELVGADTPKQRRDIRMLLQKKAARSLQAIGPKQGRRYQFAHETLLRHAEDDGDLADHAYRERIHQWAGRYQAAGWPSSTPRYLVDEYPSTLTGEPDRLAGLVGDPAWVDTAIRTVGVDQVLAGLGLARALAPARAEPAALLDVVVGQAHNLRPPAPVHQPGYVTAQLCQHAAELGEVHTWRVLQARLLAEPGAAVVPLWTTSATGRAFAGQLGDEVGAIRTMAVLPDGRLVSGGELGWLRVWDLARPGAQPVTVGRHGGSIEAVAVLPDGRVVSGGGDGRVLVWDPAEPHAPPVRLGEHAGVVTALAVLPDGRVASSGGDGRALIRDPRRPAAPPVESDGPVPPPRAVAVLPDGRVASGDGDGRVLLRDPSTPAAPPVELGKHAFPVRALVLLPDGRLASGGDDGRILVWDAARPAPLGEHLGAVQAVAVLPDGRVASGGADGRVLIWDDARPVMVGEHRGAVRAVAVLPDGRVASGGEDGRIVIGDEAIGEPRAAVRAMAVLPDGRLVSGGEDGRILIGDTALGEHGGAVRAMAVLPDGRLVSGGEDGRVLVWDPARPGTAAVEVGAHKGRLRAVAALPDGRVASGGSGRRVAVWDPARPGGAPVILGRHPHWIHMLAALPDGRLISGDNHGHLCVWDPGRAGDPPVELRFPFTALATGRLPDGRGLLVAGEHNGGISAWAMLPNAARTETGTGGVTPGQSSRV
ncbi:trypsin-like peptidase domain-containing protein [Dactylosporangium sp. CS-033363]|uniref:trypsin-like peptidase domain-containing protein n=1 Tax=Dactylosporangium sp. CS-033363 TaxID=3239935 RepID=UPI003D94F022